MMLYEKAYTVDGMRCAILYELCAAYETRG
jgi:hypothetical protein